MSDTNTEVKKLDLDDPNWAYVRTPHGTYLGVVKRLEDDTSIGQGIVVEPAYEYYINLGQAPNGGIQRQTLCLPFDNCLYSVPLIIDPFLGTLVWFSKMHPDDRKNYVKLIEQANQMAIASRSGIDLSGTNGTRR